MKRTSFAVELTLENNIGNKCSNCCLLINDFSRVTCDYHWSLSERCRDQSLLRAPTLNRINESSPLEFFFSFALAQKKMTTNITYQKVRTITTSTADRKIPVRCVYRGGKKKVCKQPWWTSTIGFVRVPIKTFDELLSCCQRLPRTNLSLPKGTMSEGSWEKRVRKRCN